MEPTPENIERLLADNAKLREQLEIQSAEASAAVRDEQNWQVAQQEKLRRHYEEQVSDLQRQVDSRERWTEQQFIMRKTSREIWF